MNTFLNLILTLILSILPVSELRGGMVFAITSGLISQISIYLISITITLANILIIFFIFFFLDFLHEKFMKIKIYRKSFDFYLEKTRKKIKKLKESMKTYGFLALVIFVAIPLPATGAWTGCIIAWILGLDRKKSILSIALGVLIAGIIVLLAGLGIIRFIKII